MRTENGNWYLGKIKGTNEKVYLYNFKWEKTCIPQYWAGGYIGNNRMHAHFDGAFLNVPDSRGHALGNFFNPWTKLPPYLSEKDVTRIENGAAIWEDLSFFLDDAQYSSDAWWRIKDLFKQFYIYKEAAGAFHSGGHCTSRGRNKAEINPLMQAMINKHIETVIIPELIDVLDNQSRRAYM